MEQWKHLQSSLTFVLAPSHKTASSQTSVPMLLPLNLFNVLLLEWALWLLCIERPWSNLSPCQVELPKSIYHVGFMMLGGRKGSVVTQVWGTTGTATLFLEDFPKLSYINLLFESPERYILGCFHNSSWAAVLGKASLELCPSVCSLQLWMASEHFEHDWSHLRYILSIKHTVFQRFSTKM